jgi:transcriptional regulator with XRE-family HTH domain
MTEIEDDEAGAGSGYNIAVGDRIRNVRRQQNLSLKAVEQMSGHEFKASILGAYERGERAISVPRLQRLARLYDVPVDQLLPPNENGPAAVPVRPPADDAEGARQPEGRSPRGEKITIDLGRLSDAQGPERDLLRRFLSSVQIQRQDFNGRVITIRGDDLRIMASMFAMTMPEMVVRLDELGLLHRG